MPEPDALGVALPTPIVVANFPVPVNVLAPEELRVPVTATPVNVTATTVFTPESNERLPLESPDITMPPPEVVTAAIVELIVKYPLVYSYQNAILA
jgi:hypothetical protein